MKPIDTHVFAAVERKNGHIHLMDNGRLSIFRTRYNAEDWTNEWGGTDRFEIMEMIMNKAYRLNRKSK